MRDYSAPSTYRVPSTGNLTDDVVGNARSHPGAVVISRRSGTGWQDLTAAQFEAEVIAVAKGLVAAGIEPGDRVALISKTRYEWTLLDYAIWWTGASTVPIYETSSQEQILWILTDSGARLAVTETAQHRDRAAPSNGGPGEQSGEGSDSSHGGKGGHPRILCLDDGDLDALVRSGRDVSNADLEARRSAVMPADLATVIYTSGTTGRPKGCMLSHGNVMFEVEVVCVELDALFDDEEASTLLFLPLAHVFARVIQVGCVKRRVRLGHSADIRHLADDLSAFRPTFILAVPRVFEKVFNTASQRATADGRGAIFNSAVRAAIAYSEATDRSGPGVLLRARHAVFDRLVYTRLRASLGGRIAYAVSGGAPLGARLAHFFRGIGLPVLEGYGLTETTAALTLNLPGDQRIGTVGRPIAGTSVRVADDGELLFRGGQVFGGYWHNEAASADVLDSDGWFHSGDVGEVDEDGFVRITGRKKEILVTAGGKNVAPAVLEDHIRAHRLVSQCLVVGDGRPFVAALVTIDPDALLVWTEAHTKSGPPATLVDDPDLLAEIQLAIDDANAAVSRAEAIRRFAVLSVDWTEETGELTPTLKLKRDVVMERFRDEVESLYL